MSESFEQGRFPSRFAVSPSTVNGERYLPGTAPSLYNDYIALFDFKVQVLKDIVFVVFDARKVANLQ
jgi:hypothetical protein